MEGSQRTLKGGLSRPRGLGIEFQDLPHLQLGEPGQHHAGRGPGLEGARTHVMGTQKPAACLRPHPARSQTPSERRDGGILTQPLCATQEPPPPFPRSQPAHLSGDTMPVWLRERLTCEARKRERVRWNRAIWGHRAALELVQIQLRLAARAHI